MAQVVYAEPGDELGSLVRKLEEAEESDLVLLVPKRTAFLEDSLHWNLLQRHVRSLGKLVVVVTQDREVRHGARQAGFAVYRSLRRLKFRPANSQSVNIRPFLRKGRASSLLVALGAVSLAVLLFLAVVTYLVFPTGAIILKPISQDVALTISVRASQETSSVGPAAGQIPARLVQSPLEGTDTIDTTGHKTSQSKARGEVTLLNRTPAPMLVPISTTLASSQGTEFLTVEQVVLAPSGGTARSLIAASQSGPSGNVGSMAIDRAIDQPYAEALAVWNELPTYGGSTEQTSTVSAQDQSNLRSRLKGKLTKDGQNQLQALKAKSESIYPETIIFPSMEESFDKELGAEASNLTLRMKGSVKGLAFDGQDVNMLAQKSIEAQVPQGFRLLPETVQVAPLEAYDWGEDWVAFRVNARAKASAIVKSDNVIDTLRGMSPSDARAYLERQFPQKEQLSVTIKPLSIDWIPVFFWKLEVRY